MDRFKARTKKQTETNEMQISQPLSMGKLHHPMMGTAAVAIGVAAAIPEVLDIKSNVNHKPVNQAVSKGSAYPEVTCGHPSGILKVGAVVQQDGLNWNVRRVIMSRSERILMEDWARVPENTVER